MRALNDRNAAAARPEADRARRWRLEPKIALACECRDRDCEEILVVPLPDYEARRGERYFTASGHDAA
jgi:hypothetical protein